MTVTQPMTPVDSSTSVTTTSATPTPPTRKPFLARIPWYAWAGRRAQHRLMDHVVGTYRRVERANDQRPDLPRHAHPPLGLYVLSDLVRVHTRAGWRQRRPQRLIATDPQLAGLRAAVSALDSILVGLRDSQYPRAKLASIFFDHPIDTNTLNGWIEYHTISSICFSTVLPAVLEIAEILASFAALRPRLARHDPGPKVKLSTAISLMLVGVAGLILPLSPHITPSGCSGWV